MIRRLFILLAFFALQLSAANRYVDKLAPGPTHDGTSWNNAWLSFAAVVQSGLSGDDVVWVKGDGNDYNEKFTIAKSGTSGHRITYIGYGTTKPTLRGINGATFTNIAIINLEIYQLTTANNYDCISLGGLSGWLIQDNYIHDTYYNAISNPSSVFNNSNIIRHNYFFQIGYVDGGSGSPVCMSLAGAGNLIEYNTVIQCPDRVQIFGGAGNVVRNNYWGATDTTGHWPSYNQQPPHIDDFQTHGSGSAVPLTKTRYSNNFSTDNGPTTDAHLSNMQDDTNNGFRWLVMEGNLIVRVGGNLLDYKNFSQTYHANNGFIAVQNGSGSNFNTTGYWGLPPPPHASDTSTGADARNNTWSYCPKARATTGLLDNTLRPTGGGFTTAANHAYNTGSNQSILPTGASPGNLPQTDPGYVDGDGTPAHDNYHLRSDSILRDAAAPYSTAVGGGTNSTALTVVDAQYFFDGWGIANPQWIRIGVSGTLVEILSIDYVTNVITLKNSRTWLNGDGVWPNGRWDVGPLPYGSADPSIHSGSVSGLTGTVTASVVVDVQNDVQMVDVTADGLPVAMTYTFSGNTFTLTWTGDGQSHVFIARAYANWATPNLVATRTLTVGSVQSIRSARFPTKAIPVVIP